MKQYQSSCRSSIYNRVIFLLHLEHLLCNIQLDLRHEMYGEKASSGIIMETVEDCIPYFPAVNENDNRSIH